MNNDLPYPAGNRVQECRALPGDRENRAAAVRARWMAELATAIDDAQRVAWQLGAAPGASLEARELYGRLEAARVELEELRGIAHACADDLEPMLLRRLGWAGALDPAGS